MTYPLYTTEDVLEAIETVFACLGTVEYEVNQELTKLGKSTSYAKSKDMKYLEEFKDKLTHCEIVFDLMKKDLK